MARILPIGTLALCAADVEALLVLCGVKIDMSIPAAVRVYFIHRETVSRETGLCGLEIAMKSGLCPPLSFSVLSMYSFNTVTIHRRLSGA